MGSGGGGWGNGGDAGESKEEIHSLQCSDGEW